MLNCSKIYINNNSAIELCKVLKITHKISAVNVKINFIRECINNKLVELHFIESEHNVADVLTKALSLAQYLLFTTFLQEGFKGIEDMTQLNTRNILNYVVHEDFINEVLNC